MVPLAAELLVTAAKGNGHLLLVESMGGSCVQASDTVFLDKDDPRAIAEHEEALFQLERLHLTRRTNASGCAVWRVTHRGFLAADHLLALGVAPKEST